MRPPRLTRGADPRRRARTSSCTRAAAHGHDEVLALGHLHVARVALLVEKLHVVEPVHTKTLGHSKQPIAAVVCHDVLGDELAVVIPHKDVGVLEGEKPTASEQEDESVRRGKQAAGHLFDFVGRRLPQARKGQGWECCTTKHITWLARTSMMTRSACSCLIKTLPLYASMKSTLRLR